MSDDEREEVHVRAVADSIRQVISEPGPDEDVSRLVEAAMGDELSDDADERSAGERHYFG
jgi:hypothetical protein